MGRYVHNPQLANTNRVREPTLTESTSKVSSACGPLGVVYFRCCRRLLISVTEATINCHSRLAHRRSKWTLMLEKFRNRKRRKFDGIEKSQAVLCFCLDCPWLWSPRVSWLSVTGKSCISSRTGPNSQLFQNPNLLRVQSKGIHPQQPVPHTRPTARRAASHRD